MRIITWNCNGAFRRKYEAISALDADILVIQECEDPAYSTKDYADWAGSYVWKGKNNNKGIGIFSKNGDEIVELGWDDNNFQQFLPVRINNEFNILAVWTKDTTSAKFGYIGQFWSYLQIHKSLIDLDTIICGDFNSNSIWDKRGRIWNHTECIRELDEIGFLSLYHTATKEAQGREVIPTLFLQRKIEKPYHIDYIFAHKERIPQLWNNISVGKYDDWIKLSDHMPIVVDI